MKTYIKNIKINNFKGIASYEKAFDEIENELIASNGNGKSTVKYAWQWVLCQNVPDVLPMLNNKEIPDLVTSVELLININNVDYTFKRESKGKYRVNENNIACKIANENSYFIDNIPIKTETEYKTKIANLLGDGTFENLVLLTDKEMFNNDTTKWKWSDRRKMLFKICNVDSAVKNIIDNPKYDDIRTLILKGNATSDIKSMLMKEKKAYKEQQNKNAILIEQKTNEIAEFNKINFEELEKELTTLTNKLNKMQTASKKELHSEKLEELQNQLLEQTQELTKLQSADTIALSNLRRFSNEIYNDAQTLYSQYNILKNKVDTIKTDIETIKGEKIETICPTCNQELPADVVETAKKNQSVRVEKLETELETINKDLKIASKNYQEKRELYTAKKAEIDNFKQNEKIVELETSIKATKTAIEQAKATKLNNLSNEDKKAIEERIKLINIELLKKQLIETGKDKIRSWQTSSRECADKIIEIEKKEIQLQDFVKEQTDIINNTVNEKFGNGISWSLYNETYKDGNGGVDEDCVCLYNGKRYSSMSTGEKHFADIEVIKVLQDYFGVCLPIFVDNAEQLTLDYEVKDRQLIKLIAQKGKKLENLIKIEELY